MNLQPVEKFKITSEMKGWLSQFKKMQAVGQALQQSSQMAQQEMMSVQQMTKQFEQGMQLLFQQMPDEPTHQVEDVA